MNPNDPLFDLDSFTFYSETFDMRDADMDIPDGQLESLDDSINTLIDRQMQMLEDRIESAIVRGFDGLDVYYPTMIQPLDESLSVRIQKTESWKRPAPEPESGYRVRRYSWHWFDNNRLERAIKTGEIDKLVSEMNED